MERERRLTLCSNCSLFEKKKVVICNWVKGLDDLLDAGLRKVQSLSYEKGQIDFEEFEERLRELRARYERILMIIGEAPGFEEEKDGVPFVGKSGILLRNTLKECLEKHSFFDGKSLIYITNACKCKPTDEKGGIRQPSVQEVELCRKVFLQMEIEILQPVFIIALGKVSARVLNVPNIKLEEMRGVIQFFEDRFMGSGIKIPFLVTYHPSHILRNQYKNYALFKNDIEKVLNKISGEDRGFLAEKVNVQPEILTDTGKILSLLEGIKRRSVQYQKVMPVAIDFETTPISFELVNKKYSKWLSEAGLNPTSRFSDICYCGISLGSDCTFVFPVRVRSVLKVWKEYLTSVVERFSEIEERVKKDFESGKIKSKLDLYYLYWDYGFCDKEVIEKIVEARDREQLRLVLSDVKKWFLQMVRECEKAEVEVETWNYDEEVVVDALRELLKCEGIKFVIQNPQFEWAFIKSKLGIELKSFYGTDLFEYLMGYTNVSLSEIEKRYFGSNLKEKYKGKSKDSLRDYMDYNGMDVALTFSIFVEQINRLTKDNFFEKSVSNSYRRANLRSIVLSGMEFLTKIVVPVVGEMKINGLPFDVEKNRELYERLNERLEKLYDEIEKITGLRNVHTQEFKERFYEIYQGEKVTTAKGSLSLSKDAVIEIYKKAEEETVKRLCSYVYTVMKLEKLLSSYIENFPFYVDPQTGRCYPSYNITKTATGRLSCERPNIQQVPREATYCCPECGIIPIDGKKCPFCDVEVQEFIDFREVFAFREGEKRLVIMDYSQIEMAILAELSGDRHLIEAINKGLDMHSYNASKVYGVPYEEIVEKKDSDPDIKRMRQNAKKVTFAVIYGATDEGIAKRENISVEEAKKIIDTFYSVYPETKKWIDERHEEVRRLGLVATPVGRVRWFMSGDGVEGTILRQAQNTPIQSFASDINLFTCEILRRKGFKIVGAIHDSIVIEVENEREIEQLVKEFSGLSEVFKRFTEVCQLLGLRKVPMLVRDFTVTLRVDYHWGFSWKEAKG